MHGLAYASETLAAIEGTKRQGITTRWAREILAHPKLGNSRPGVAVTRGLVEATIDTKEVST